MATPETGKRPRRVICVRSILPTGSRDRRALGLRAIRIRQTAAGSRRQYGGCRYAGEGLRNEFIELGDIAGSFDSSRELAFGEWTSGQCT